MSRAAAARHGHGPGREAARVGSLPDCAGVRPGFIPSLDEAYLPMCPLTHSDGHDGAGLVDEPVPGVTAVVDDIVVGSEHAV